MHALVDVKTKEIIAIRVTDESRGDAPMLLELLDEGPLQGGRRRRRVHTGRLCIPNGSCCLYDEVEDGADVSILGDGTYCHRQDMAGCAERNVTPNLKVSITSGTGSSGTGCAWGREVQKQLGGGPGRPVGRLSRKEREANREEWKKNVGYGKRWIVEIVFSAFKRMFGNHLYSKKWDSMVLEVNIKVATYNRWSGRPWRRLGGMDTV